MAEATTRRTRRPWAGEGTVYRATDGRWRGVVTWTEPGGRRCRRTVSGVTSVAARAALDVLRNELRLGTIAPAGSATTTGDYLTTWIERDRTRVRPSTWRTREMHVRVYLVPALARIPLAKLSAAYVERALSAFLATGRPDRPAKRGRGRQNAAGVAAQTVRHIRTTLRRALADAVRDGRSSRNVAADARPPYVAHRPITYLAARDLRKLLEATHDDELGPVYALAATTGLRLGRATRARVVGRRRWDAHGPALAREGERRRMGARAAEVGTIPPLDPAPGRRTAGARGPAIAPAVRPERRRRRVAGPRRARVHRRDRASAAPGDSVPVVRSVARDRRRPADPIPRSPALRSDDAARGRRPAGGHQRGSGTPGSRSPRPPTPPSSRSFATRPLRRWIAPWAVCRERRGRQGEGGARRRHWRGRLAKGKARPRHRRRTGRCRDCAADPAR